MAQGFIEPREQRACIWDGHALLNQIRAREADKIGTPLGAKIAADCREAVKRALEYSARYRN